MFFETQFQEWLRDGLTIFLQARSALERKQWQTGKAEANTKKKKISEACSG